MAQNGGKRPGAGRPKGQPNKATRALKELARKYTFAAIAALAEIVNNIEAPAKARVDAANALLDRGHGRPAQTIETEIDQTITVKIVRFGNNPAE